MVGQLSVVKGAGELGGVRDYGGNGSIHQSISNEGKDRSKSSTWKSCSAWGGPSLLCVSSALEQQRPKWRKTVITLDQ